MANFDLNNIYKKMSNTPRSLPSTPYTASTPNFNSSTASPSNVVLRRSFVPAAGSDLVDANESSEAAILETPYGDTVPAIVHTHLDPKSPRAQSLKATPNREKNVN